MGIKMKNPGQGIFPVLASLKIHLFRNELFSKKCLIFPIRGEGFREVILPLIQDYRGMRNETESVG